MANRIPGWHIHYWGCVNCGDSKVCSKCMKCPCVLNAAKKQLRSAKMGKGWLDVYYLDILMNAGYTPDRLKDIFVDWHGRKGTTLKLGDVLAIKVRIPCDGGTLGQRCKRRLVLLVKSGVHFGAFCKVVDHKGNVVADLREQNALCQQCGHHTT